MKNKEIEELIDCVISLKSTKKARLMILHNESIEYDAKQGRCWSEPYNLGYTEGLMFALSMLELLMNSLDLETKKRIQEAINKE